MVLEIEKHHKVYNMSKALKLYGDVWGTEKLINVDGDPPGGQRRAKYDIFWSFCGIE